MPGFMDALLGTQGQFKQVSQYTPQQQQAFSQLLQGGLGGLQNPQQFASNPLAQGAIKNFNQNTIPSLAERFTSLGSGAQRSSAFQGALGSAASGLQSDIMGQLLQMIGLGLTPQHENVYEPGQEGFINPLLQLAGTVAGGYFGGPGGAAAGNVAGSGIGEWLKGLREGNKPSSGYSGTTNLVPQTKAWAQQLAGGAFPGLSRGSGLGVGI